MANEKVTFSKGLSESLPQDHIAGRLLVETDTGNVFLDTSDSTRIQITDTRKLSEDGTNTMTGNLDMGSHKILNVVDPDNDQDAATKHYVDTTSSNYLPLAGGSMSGSINMGSNKISTSYTASDLTDVVNKQYVDAQNAFNLKTSGVTPMTGNLNMSNHKITNISTPESATDAVNKSYVDSSIGNITSFKVDSNRGSGYASLDALKSTHPEGESGVFYLVVNTSASAPNAFDEYFWTGTDYEKAGGFGDVDFTNFATKQDLNSYLPLTGGTISGPINSSITPTESTNLVNKQYVDSAVTSSAGSPSYIFLASFDGTTLTATPVGGTPSDINWKPGDVAYITVGTSKEDKPLYYGNFSFKLGAKTIPISTVSVPHGSSDMYIQQTTLIAVYVTVNTDSALMVISTDNVIHIDSNTSGLKIALSNATGQHNSITHMKLPQTEIYGPDITKINSKLDYGSTFVVPTIGYDVNGHVVSGSQTTFQLPDLPPSTDTNVTQTTSNANSDFRLLLSNSANDATETAGVYKSGELLFNPSTGVLIAPKFNGTIDDGVIV